MIILENFTNDELHGLKDRCQKILDKRRDEKTAPIPDYGDHMTLQDFIECCEQGCFIDYDGVGQYASATEVYGKTVYPSDVAKNKLDKTFTHVVWFNR